MDDTINNCIEQGNWEALKDCLHTRYQSMNLREGNILQHVAEKAPDIRPFIQYFPADMTDEYGRTALWWAALRGQIANMRALLEAGANPNLSDHKGLTPLFVAANGTAVSLLYEFGAQLQAFDQEGTPLLEYVERSGRKDAADRMRELGGTEAPSGFTLAQDSSNYGERFETFGITPHDLVEKLDADHGALRGIIIDGERYRLTPRFLKGMAARMKVPFTIFNLFSPLEVIYRTAERQPELPLRITLDHTQKEALGLVEEKGNILPIGQITSILRQDSRLQKIEYEAGVLNAILDANEQWDIPGDSIYKVQLNFQIPVDGMGEPNINLATFRQICSNGATVQESSFRTKMEIKDNSGLHFSKLLKSFNNRNGMEMLHQRLMDANSTKASVRELLEVDGLMRNLVRDRHNSMLLREELLTLADNPCARYGVTDLTAIGEKRRSLAPVGCSVADLLNFTSELATHHSNLLKETGPLNVFHGRTLAKTFDLEEMYTNSVEARDFYLKQIEFQTEAR